MTSKVQVKTPDDIVGDACQEINANDGVITNISTVRDGWTVIDVHLPSTTVWSFRNWLEQRSGGKGSVTDEPD